MSNLETQMAILMVDLVDITQENIGDVADWCGGTVFGNQLYLPGGYGNIGDTVVEFPEDVYIIYKKGVF